MYNHFFDVNLGAFLTITAVFKRLDLGSETDRLLSQHLVGDKLGDAKATRVGIARTVKSAIFNGNVFYH